MIFLYIYRCNVVGIFLDEWFLMYYLSSLPLNPGPQNQTECIQIGIRILTRFTSSERLIVRLTN
jgi:hypothetical protein